ncbi:MAG: glycosyltransferase family 2 protein [Clostridiales Family XIII bacterium]|jgi:glycosyltransferase involved in cell wall biosynthesis|nr:glycosyltransferase family 2 protein [Clostridiales Family XIII bacterium]
MPKVSIIIPVWNTEPYLKRCLDSVVNQTLRDIEIICINDASPDNALAVLREYEAQDSRIKIIDFTENKGVSVARNVGIKTATGKYLGFVDSDDYVDLDFYEKLYERAVETGAEVVVGTLREYSLSGRIVEHKEFISRIKNNKANFNVFFLAAIYNKDFIFNHKIEFTEHLSYSEDILFPVKASCFASKLEVVENIFYNYVRRADSADGEFLQEKDLLCVLECNSLVFNFINSLKDISSEEYKIIAKYFLFSTIHIFLKIPDSNLSFLEQRFCQLYFSINPKYVDDILPKKDFDDLYFILKTNNRQSITNMLKKLENSECLRKLRKNVIKRESMTIGNNYAKS